MKGHPKLAEFDLAGKACMFALFEADWKRRKFMDARGRVA
jgi:hypothetical protein